MNQPHAPHTIDLLTDDEGSAYLERMQRDLGQRLILREQIAEAVTGYALECARYRMKTRLTLPNPFHVADEILTLMEQQEHAPSNDAATVGLR